MIEVKEIAAGYGRLTAVKNISLSVAKGEIVAVVGPNGAGKSTLLKCIMGLLPASNGEVLFEGSLITGLRTSAIVKCGITLVPESRELFPSLSVLDNLLLGAYAHRQEPNASARRQDTLAEVLSLFPVLEDKINTRAALLSGGQQQMVAIGRALMTRPKALLFDEPSLGIAPIVIRSIFEAISRLRDKGMAILLVEQNVRMALRIAERAYVLETGTIVIEARVGSDESANAIVQSYFGKNRNAPSRVTT